MNAQVLIAFFVYFLVILSIGIISYKKQTSAADFIVGNRSLNFWVTALSAHASDMSSWLFMAFPAAIFIGGLSQSWIAIGLLGGMFLNWQFVAKKLRNATEKYDSYTLSTFFEKRFRDHSGVIRVLTALMAIFFLTCYVAAGLMAMGGILESVFGIDRWFGMIVATLVIMIYTFAGGFITVAWTDLFQALFLLTAILIVPSIAFLTLENGFGSIQSAASLQDINLNFFVDSSLESILSISFIILGWGLGYFGQPHIVTKFMGIKNANEMNKSKYVGMTWQLIALTAAAFVGLVGIAFFKEGLRNPETVFIQMVQSLFNPLLAGFILCGVIAASVSTMDSQILVSASVLSEDFYKHLVHKKASSKQLLWVSRLGVILVSIISLMFALNNNKSILDAVFYAWAGLGSAFGPLILVALYSNYVNKYGAIAGIITGGVVAGAWSMINPYVIDIPIPSMIPGFFLSILSIYLFSWLTQFRQPVRPNAEMI